MLRNLILVSIAASFCLNAQEQSRFGVKLIVTRSNVEYLNREPQLDYFDGPLFSPGIAVFYEPIRTNFLTVLSEISFLRKGTSENRVYYIPYESSTVRADSRTTFDFTYLQFEVNLQPTWRLDLVQLYAIAGLTTSYLLNVNYLVVAPADRKHLLFGYSIGIGCDFSAAINTPLFAEIEFNADFSTAYEFGTLKLRHRLLAFSIGARI